MTFTTGCSSAQAGRDNLIDHHGRHAVAGGVDVTTTVEGRERYPIQIRFQRDVRERLNQLKQVPVVTHTSEVVPLERLAQVAMTWGPGAINSEDARLVAHVAFSPDSRQLVFRFPAALIGRVSESPPTVSDFPSGVYSIIRDLLFLLRC